MRRFSGRDGEGWCFRVVVKGVEGGSGRCRGEGRGPSSEAEPSKLFLAPLARGALDVGHAAHSLHHTPRGTSTTPKIPQPTRLAAANKAIVILH